MGHEITVVDSSTPDAISDAIKKVNQTPGLRLKPGIQALWTIYKAPNHTISWKELQEQYEVDLHFGWFCRRVAEELGDREPDALALVNYSTSEAGERILTLKPAVVAALSAKFSNK